ncbi:hypothetical protein K431DRAFT_282058 [Polychaeton citri CBS 116435]|uniref:Uncharacterized protein n=1 Tax=Polychaeton citri CBS 116435 TaxID=1314669 RepID=A0A9P4QE62_9PEZI|nr:hypothetical protein K431DRAFT_282058 [Polychaeton citri CBS 116435]
MALHVHHALSNRAGGAYHLPTECSARMASGSTGQMACWSASPPSMHVHRHRSRPSNLSTGAGDSVVAPPTDALLASGCIRHLRSTGLATVAQACARRMQRSARQFDVLVPHLVRSVAEGVAFLLVAVTDGDQRQGTVTTASNIAVSAVVRERRCRLM